MKTAKISGASNRKSVSREALLRRICFHRSFGAWDYRGGGLTGLDTPNNTWEGVFGGHYTRMVIIVVRIGRCGRSRFGIWVHLVNSSSDGCLL